MKKSKNDLPSPERILKTMADTNAKLAESVVPTTVGECVLRIVESRAPLTLDSLLAALQSDIDASSSARGKGKPEHDLRRLTAEAAIKRLRALDAP